MSASLVGSEMCIRDSSSSSSASSTLSSQSRAGRPPSVGAHCQDRARQDRPAQSRPLVSSGDTV
eukprot:11353944-Alexandrium_andersonii.AAC.1